MTNLGLPMRPDRDPGDPGPDASGTGASGTGASGTGASGTVASGPDARSRHAGGRHSGARGRTGRRRRARLVGWVAGGVIVVLVVGVAWAAAAGLTSALRSRFGGPADYDGPPGPPTQVRVVSGATAADIGSVLARADVVASQEAFVDAASADPRSTSIQPGTYRLATRLPAADALSALLDPASRVVRRVTVPEGLRLDETVDRLVRDSGIPRSAFVAVLRDAARDPRILGLPDGARSAEGYLFPATYDVEPGMSAKDLLRAMVDTFHRNATQAGLTSGSRPTAELVTIASLVEAEARRAQDRGPVARVIENRLAAGMPLQLDATVNYALRADKTLITYRDLTVTSAYNTYRHTGLPPGPIDSPGLAAMRAAADPPPGDWLYFVTVNPATGETKFTASYAEFLRFKAELDAHQ